MLKISISLAPVSCPRSGRARRWVLGTAIACVSALPLLASAAPVAGLNSFTDGDVISAEEFNDNFDELALAINDNDARISGLEADALPTGAVMFFNADMCPAGWTELEEARGRTIVGVNGSAGDLMGTVGSALGNLAAVSHGHTIAAGATASTSPDPVPHTHDSGTYSTDTEPAHNHQWLNNGSSSYNASGGAVGVASIPLSGGTAPLLNPSGDLYTSNAGGHLHNVVGTSDQPPAEQTVHSHSIELAGQPVASATTSLPYIQLLACQRS